MQILSSAYWVCQDLVNMRLCRDKVSQVIANGDDVGNINRILAGEEVGTLFKAQI